MVTTPLRSAVYRLGIVAVAALWAWPLAAQQPTFRADTRVVPLYATVRDREGHLVPDLSKEAFQVFDNGKPVELTVFSNDSQPITVAVMLDVSGNFIDLTKYERVRRAMLGFVAALRPVDRARIGTFAEREIAIGATLTSDKDELTRVLWEEFWSGQGGRPLWSALGAAMTSLRDEPGRRVALLLVDGPNTSAMPGGATFKTVEQHVLADDFMIYAITFAGAPSGVQRRGSGSRDDDPHALAQLTARTGGGHFQAPNGANLTTAVANVAEELRHQYALGFTPAILDNKIHTIEVRMASAGLTARTRTDYLATSRR